MKIHHIYTDTQGESHFADIDVEYVETLGGGRLSKRFPVTSLIFRETPPAHSLDWHPAPWRQYIVNLDNGVQTTVSDGETRVIGAGEVILVEDTTGKGHLTQALNDKMRHAVFVLME
jgi:quercetin dioxygenase-like cupin family protein